MLTLFEGALDGVWIDVTEVGRESVCVLDVDGLSGADEGEEGVKGDEADACCERRHGGK